jgi:subtilisin family serine protease
MSFKVSPGCVLLTVLSLFTLALVVSGDRFSGAKAFKLKHSTLSIHTSSYSNVQDRKGYADATAAVSAAALASPEEKEALSDFIFHKSHRNPAFSLHGSTSASAPGATSSFSTRSLGAKPEDVQFFVHFSTRCDVGTLLAFHKFTGHRIIAHIDGGLYVAIGGKAFAQNARKFPGVSWVQEREGSSKLSSSLQHVLKKPAATVKEHLSPHPSSGGNRVAFTEIIAECWYDGCAAAASAVRSVCPDVYVHPTLVEVHCAAQSLHAAVSALSGHVGIDHVDIKPVHRSFNFGGSAIIGSGATATSPKESLVLSRIDVNKSIIGIADSGIDINNCFFHDDSHSFSGRVVHTYEVQPCEKCGRCCTSNSGQHCSNQSNTCGNFIDQSAHGTHVAGTVAGSGPDVVSYGNGVASGAKIFFQDIENYVNASVCNSDDCTRGLSPPTDLFDLFAPAYHAGARVHTNSWGSMSNFYTTNSRAVDAFTSSHPTFVVLFAAGNDGRSSHLGSIGAPATCKNCLAVGASQQSESLLRSMEPFVDGGAMCEDPLVFFNEPCCANPRSCVDRCCHWANVLNTSLSCCAIQPACIGSNSCADNHPSATNVVDFSSRGATADGRFKPDIVAPGQNILSAATPVQLNPNIAFSPTSPNYCGVPNNAHGRSPAEHFNMSLSLMSGTSMATPLVAGAVEKIRQYFVQGYYPLGARATGSQFEPAEALVRAVVIASCSSSYTDPSWSVLSSSEGATKVFRSSLSINTEFIQGFGLPVLDHAVYMADSSNGYKMFYTNQTYSPNSPATAYNIPCNHSATIPLTLILVWTDPPGHTDSDKSLVNDLDLIVIPGGFTSQIFGNMRAHADSINTVERVVTHCPVAGFVTAIVDWDTLRTASQDWYLVANGPVTSGFSPTPLPPYSRGRWTRVDTQSESCIGQTVHASVSFVPNSGWSCAGQPSNIGLAGNLDCRLLSQEFASSLAHILGVPVHGIVVYYVDPVAITMSLTCSAMINSMGSGLSLKYVTPTAQFVAIQNAFATSHNTSFFSMSPFNVFDWSTFAVYEPPPSQPPHTSEWNYRLNPLARRLSFATIHLCTSGPVSRSCLLRNNLFSSGQFYDLWACMQAQAQTNAQAFCLNYIFA